MHLFVADSLPSSNDGCFHWGGQCQCQCQCQCRLGCSESVPSPLCAITEGGAYRCPLPQKGACIRGGTTFGHTGIRFLVGVGLDGRWLSVPSLPRHRDIIRVRSNNQSLPAGVLQALPQLRESFPNVIPPTPGPPTPTPGPPAPAALQMHVAVPIRSNEETQCIATVPSPSPSRNGVVPGFR